MDYREQYGEPKRRANAAQELLRHPNFALLRLLLDEIEEDALASLRAGELPGEHVAAIRAVEIVRRKLRLEAESVGVRSDIV